MYSTINNDAGRFDPDELNYYNAEHILEAMEDLATRDYKLTKNVRRKLK